MNIIAKFLLLGLAMRAGVIHTHAQSTAFTYNGRLADGGTPAHGQYELRFALFDAGTAGNPVGQPLTHAPVAVITGLFAVQLDFGSGVFTGTDRWLEIGVRTNGAPHDFVTLAPRQPIAPTPYAIYARQAGSMNAANLTGTIPNAQFPANVARLDGTQTFTGANTFNHPSNRFTGKFTGDGAGVTNLNAADLQGIVPEAALASVPATSLSGAIADARLSLNIPRLDADQSFHGVNSFHRNLAINDRDMLLRGPQDPNHGLGWYGDGKPFGGRNPDGPVLYGWAGGALGSMEGGQETALAWNNLGGVFIDPASANDGSVTSGKALLFGAFNSGEGIASKRTEGGNRWGLDFYTAYANRMTIANDGNVGIGTTTPSARLEVSGAVKAAAFVGDGSGLTGLNGATIPPGGITAVQLAPGAAAANLNASGQSGVPSGGLVLSLTDNNSALVYAGYVRIGATLTTSEWRQRVNGTPPSARFYHTAVWTGSEMIVWGGLDDLGNLNDGSRYDPAGNSWTAVSTIGAPTARHSHTAVWTGTEMIVWGGFDEIGNLNDGGRYDPAGNSWTAVSTIGAPTARHSYTAVWTGSEMIVWGGFSSGNYMNDGGRYNPASDSWTAVNTSGAPDARHSHTAVWTGSEMIVWGGYVSSLQFTDAGRYNPADNSWTSVSTDGAPGGRWDHTAVWTGSEMIIWGGFDGNAINHGGRYNPADDSWTAVKFHGAPAARDSHTAVWTGSEMIVWGGQDEIGYLNNGGRYRPTDNIWTAVNPSGAPEAYPLTVVWTGSEMIVWGRTAHDVELTNPFSYIPGRVLYLYQRQ